MRALLVVNPQATSATEAARDVLAHAVASEAKLETVETRYRGHAESLARQAVLDRIDLVIAHGGDGTVNEVVNGLLGGPPGVEVPVLGVVPGGSANVFARALGLPCDPVEATHRLLRAVEQESSRSVGLGRANGRWFTFNAGLGWDAEVVAEVDRRRARGRRVTPMLYMSVALTSYFRLARGKPKISVDIPGEGAVHDLHQIFVSNTDPWSYLGARPVRLNPECTFDGGLGVFGLRSMRMTTVVRHVTQALCSRATPQGKYAIRAANLPSLHVTCTEPLRLQVDGDNLGEHSEVEFDSVSAALRVAV